MEVDIWCAQVERDAAFSLVMELDRGCDTRIIGGLTDTKDEPCASEEEGEPWSAEDTVAILTLAGSSGRSSSEGPCICRAEVSEYEL